MIVLPRIAKHSVAELLKTHLSNDIAQITRSMPDLNPTITYPVGGCSALKTRQLEQLRERHTPGLHTSTECRTASSNCLSLKAARLLRQALPMSANEASHEEVWSYHCCWLLDVAVWRFGVDADERRFIGNVNRNTFRRLWWRAEILGPDIDLTKLGEDELVNIMERPTIASDRRLARTIALSSPARVHEGAADSRMQPHARSDEEASAADTTGGVPSPERASSARGRRTLLHTAAAEGTSGVPSGAGATPAIGRP